MPTLSYEDMKKSCLIEKVIKFCTDAQKKNLPAMKGNDVKDISDFVMTKWVSETWDTILKRVIPEEFWSDEKMKVPTKGKGLCPMRSDIPSAIVLLVLWSCFTPKCSNMIKNCLNYAQDGANTQINQHAKPPSRKFILSWIEAYSASMNATVWYLSQTINKISYKWESQDTLILGHPILCEACFLHLAIERSSKFATAIGTNANAGLEPIPTLVVQQYLNFLLKKNPQPPFWQPLPQMLIQPAPPNEQTGSWFADFGIDNYFLTDYLTEHPALTRETTTSKNIQGILQDILTVKVFKELASSINRKQKQFTSGNISRDQVIKSITSLAKKSSEKLNLKSDENLNLKSEEGCFPDTCLAVLASFCYELNMKMKKHDKWSPGLRLLEKFLYDAYDKITRKGGETLVRDVLHHLMAPSALFSENGGPLFIKSITLCGSHAPLSIPPDSIWEQHFKADYQIFKAEADVAKAENPNAKKASSNFATENPNAKKASSKRKVELQEDNTKTKKERKAAEKPKAETSQEPKKEKPKAEKGDTEELKKAKKKKTQKGEEVEKLKKEKKKKMPKEEKKKPKGEPKWKSPRRKPPVKYPN
jgi:hypothetical protein